MPNLLQALVRALVERQLTRPAIPAVKLATLPLTAPTAALPLATRPKRFGARSTTSTHCQFTLSENKFIFRDLQRLWMKRKLYRPPCRWKALGLLFHFVVKLKKKLRTSWLFLGLGGVKPDNLKLSLITYLTPFLAHDALA